MGRERVEEEIRTSAEQGQYQAQKLGEKARQSLAGGLHTAAERLRHQARERGQPSLANRLAEPLERSAQYLGTHSLSQIGHDANLYVREHPLTAAAGVFATAFLVGRLVRRR